VSEIILWYLFRQNHCDLYYCQQSNDDCAHVEQTTFTPSPPPDHKLSLMIVVHYQNHRQSSMLKIANCLSKLPRNAIPCRTSQLALARAVDDAMALARYSNDPLGAALADDDGGQ